MPILTLARVPFDDPRVQALVLDLQGEFIKRYGGIDHTPVDSTEFDDPHGWFLLGTVGDLPVAMGGWRFRPDVTTLGGVRIAEIKRMYVVPAHQRQGHARTVLAEVEATAAAAGADVLVLETGTGQPEALGLYADTGYVPIDARYGVHAGAPEVRYLGKRLSGASSESATPR